MGQITLKFSIQKPETYCLTHSRGQGSGSGLGGWVWYRVPHGGCNQGISWGYTLQSFSLIQGRFCFQAHSCEGCQRLHFNAQAQLFASLRRGVYKFIHVGLLRTALPCQLASLRKRYTIYKRKQERICRRKPQSFYNLISEVTSCGELIQG